MQDGAQGREESWSDFRARCDAILDGLPLDRSAPVTVEALCAAIERRHGRRLRLSPLPPRAGATAGVCGVWVGLGDTDHVLAAARERLAALGFSGARLTAATEAVVLRCAIVRAGRAGPAPRPSPPGPSADGDPLGRLGLLSAQCRHPHVRTVSTALAAAARDP